MRAVLSKSFKTYDMYEYIKLPVQAEIYFGASTTPKHLPLCSLKITTLEIIR